MPVFLTPPARDLHRPHQSTQSARALCAVPDRLLERLCHRHIDVICVSDGIHHVVALFDGHGDDDVGT